MSGSIAVDTNLLVYAYDEVSPFRQAAQGALTRAASAGEWGIAVFSLGEYWSVASRPNPAGAGGPAARASAFLRQLLRAGVQVWLPSEMFAVRLLQAAQELHVFGPGIFDLQIALTVRDRGAAEIWTHDRNFPQLPGLAVVDPLFDI